MKRRNFVLSLAATGALLAAPASAKVMLAQDAPATRPKVQVAILLDTSSSMDGLINQAKAELWSIVNRIGESNFRGKRPIIEVALFEYGKDTIPSGEGYLRQISPLTTDLDQISEELFALKTYGGSEYAGMVIDRATTGLTWSKRRSDYKAIFIAGNEPFNQGPVRYADAIARAVKKGIVVNTIHCGGERAGIQGKWQHGAQLGGGSFLTINQNVTTLQIATPYDKELAVLSGRLNQTYVGYGRYGAKKMARQSAQDSNAAKMGASSVAARAKTKGGGSYNNSGWDLVDGVSSGKADVSKMEKEQLPPAMRKMNIKQRKAYVAKKSKERSALKKKIASMSKKRDAYVAKKRAKAGKETTLDKAMRRTVNKQMKRKGYRFSK